MPRPDVRFSLPYLQAKKLLEALSKGVFDKLTPAQAEAIEDLVVELSIQVGA